MRFVVPCAVVVVLALAGCPSAVPVPEPQPASEGEGEPAGGEGEGEPAEGEGEGGPGGEGEGEPGGEGEGEPVGEGEGEPGGGGGGEGEGEPVVDHDAVALQVVSASTLPGRVTDDALRLMWEVASLASQLNNRGVVVTSGTLDLRGNGNGSYSAQPAAELVYLDDGGVDVRFTVTTFDGDFANASDARGFYARSHDVVLARVVVDDDDFACESHLNGATGSRAGAGDLTGGFTFDFTSTVRITADFGRNSVDYISDETRSGNVSGDGGLDLDFADASRYRVVVFDNVAEELVNTLTVAGTAGGSTWSLQNGLLRRTFSNARAVEVDFWAGSEGDLLRNGAAFGLLGARASAQAIELVLQTPGGIQVLETHAR